MTTVRQRLKTSGTVSVNRDFFLNIISVHCSFSGGRGVSVWGEGYVWFLFLVVLVLCLNAEVQFLFGL